MAEVIKEALRGNVWFYVLAGIAIALLIASWIWPPTAIIDSSVLIATSEIFAFAALGTVIKAIDNGHSATIQHGNTSVTIGKDEDGEGEDGPAPRPGRGR